MIALGVHTGQMETGILAMLSPDAARARVAGAMDGIIFEAASLISSSPDLPVGVYGHLQNAWLQNRGVEVTATAITGFLNPTATAPYAWHVVHGTRPHFPPPRAIAPWVAKKWGYGPKESLGVAFLIARAISVRGTKPNDFITPIINEHRADWSARLGKALHVRY